MASSQQLRSRIGQLHAQIKNLEAQLEEAICEESGLIPGALLAESSYAISKGSALTGRRGIYTRIRNGRWPQVKLLKADGTPGSRLATFYYWRHV